MKQRKHAGVGVPGARTLEDCGLLVDTPESTRHHCIQLENCCYGCNKLLVWNRAHYMDINRGDYLASLGLRPA